MDKILNRLYQRRPSVHFAVYKTFWKIVLVESVEKFCEYELVTVISFRDFQKYEIEKTMFNKLYKLI